MSLPDGALPVHRRDLFVVLPWGRAGAEPCGGAVVAWRTRSGLRAAAVEVMLTVSGSRTESGAADRRRTHPREDGSFVFWDVPPGTHLLEVTAMGFLYPPIRVDVSAQHDGKASARRRTPNAFPHPARVGLAASAHSSREPTALDASRRPPH